MEMPDCALQAAAMLVLAACLPLLSIQLHSPLTQQVPNHAAPMTGHGYGAPSCPLPRLSAALPMCTDHSHVTVSLQLLLLSCLNPGGPL